MDVHKLVHIQAESLAVSDNEEQTYKYQISLNLKVLYGFQSICKQKCKHLMHCKWYNWMYLLTFGQCHL